MSELTAPDLGSWFARGWKAFTNNPRPLILASLIMSGISIVMIFLMGTLPGLFIYWIFSIFIAPVLSVGFYNLSLKAVREKAPGLDDLFTVFSRYGIIWILMVLLVLMVSIGIILLIIPGIILGLIYGGSIFAIIDGKDSVGEAFRYSAQISKGYRWHLFGMMILAVLLYFPSIPFVMGLQTSNTTVILIGIIPFLASVMIILPWVATTFAAAYDSLASRKMEIAATTAAES